jgi:hypothetical protein
MNKGVVMEISEKFLIVMTPEGSFDRIPSKNRSCQIGEEIMYASRQQGMRQPAFAVLSVFVAAVVMCMVLFSGLPAVFADKSIVAYISIDINPSLELGIDKNKRVREVKGLNEKGLDLVRDMSYNGKSLDDVTEKILQKAEDMKLFEAGEADIVIASAVVSDAVKLDDSLVTEQMKQQVLAHMVMKHPQEAEKMEVTAFAAPAEIIETAQQSGLSLGKYTVYLNAKSTGHDIKVEDLQKDSVHNIANVEGGISKLVDTKKLEKNSIKELIKEEKDGSLDKKVQDKKKESSPSSKSGQKATPTPKATNSSKGASPTPKASNKPAAATPTPTRNTQATKSPGKNDDKNNNGKNDDKNNNGKNDDKNNNGKNDDKNNNGKNDDKNNNGKNDDKTNNGKNDDKNNNGKNDDKNNNGKNDDKNNTGKNDNKTPGKTPGKNDDRNGRD